MKRNQDNYYTVDAVTENNFLLNNSHLCTLFRMTLHVSVVSDGAAEEAGLMVGDYV